MSNALVGQSGGPTVAINASLAGVIEGVLGTDKIDKIYGSIHGITGILEDRVIELNDTFKDAENLDLLASTPAMYLKSCRYRLKDEDMSQLVSQLQKYDIKYFFYIGGNDSMDTVMKLNAYIKEHNLDIIALGIPKTIDNDLAATDHCPGYGSAAKYVATTVCEVARDCFIYNTKTIVILEIMGRNAGWLTAAAALAKCDNMTAPHYVYLPERAFDIDKFLADMKEGLDKYNHVIVAVSEGIKDKGGNYIAESSLVGKSDSFGHAQLGGVAKVLEGYVKEKLGVKCRGIEINVLQRSASHLASATDIDEARTVGRKAVEFALNGESGKMMIYKRISSEPYEITYEASDINGIANAEKIVPDEYINAEGNNVTDEFIKYAKPLIIGQAKNHEKDGMPVHLSLYKG